MINFTRIRVFYVIGDYLMANVAWFLFNLYRYGVVDPIGLPETFGQFYDLPDVRLGQLLFPLLMVGLFYLSGYYRTVVSKSIFEEIAQTLLSTLIGALIIFFIAIINDTPGDRETDVKLIMGLWFAMFVFVYVFRSIVTRVISAKVKRKLWRFNTLVVCNSVSGVNLVESLRGKLSEIGVDIVGFVASSPLDVKVKDNTPVFYNADIKQLVEKLSVSRILMVPDEHELPATTLNVLYSLFGIGVPIFMPMSLYHILLSRPKINKITGEPFINVSEANVNDSSMCIKRAMDIFVSSAALILLSPLYALIALAIKIDSKGPVFYRQERIGYHQHPFKIIKFRSMIENAESTGPALSTDTDMRVTRIGHFLRKYRLDELPQFLNVLKGEMSLIGPRPERAYYINKIMERAPYYSLLHQVRPGITSLGMVKYGYASDIDGMIERLSYDLIYLENISLSTDIKILCYTILTVLKGRGV